MGELTREELLTLTTARLLDTPKTSGLMVKYPNACMEVLKEEWVCYNGIFTWKLDQSFYGGVDDLLTAAILWLDRYFDECIDCNAEELWLSILRDDGAMVERALKVVEGILDQ